MGKSNRLKADDMIKTRFNQTGEDKTGFKNTVTPKLNDAYSRENQVFDKAFGGYGDLIGRLGGSASSKYGSWDPTRVASIDQNVGEFKDFAHGNTDQGKMYKDWLNTGGISEPERADFRSRATSVIPSIYEGAKRNLNRSNTIQGGINPGYTAQSRQITDDSARASQQAATGAEVDLSNMIRSGKLEAGGRLDSNFMNGMGAANNTELELARGLGDSSMQNNSLMLNALSGLRGLRTDNPGESSNLLQMLLAGDQLYGGQGDGLIKDQQNEDAARWNRKKTIGGLLAGGAGTAAGGFGNLGKLGQLAGSGFQIHA